MSGKVSQSTFIELSSLERIDCCAIAEHRALDILGLDRSEAECAVPSSARSRVPARIVPVRVPVNLGIVWWEGDVSGRLRFVRWRPAPWPRHCP